MSNAAYRLPQPETVLFWRDESRLQTVSKTGAYLRVLSGTSEEIEPRLNLLIFRAKQRIGVRRRLATLVQVNQVRFPCATANCLISLVLLSRPGAFPNCLQK